MLTVKCRDDAAYVANYYVMMKWPFVRRIFQSSVPCEETATHTIDLSEYLSYCAMHLIYSCLATEFDSSDLLKHLLEWTRQCDIQDIVNNKKFFGLDDSTLFEPLVGYATNDQLVGSEMRLIYEYIGDACESLEQAAVAMGCSFPTTSDSAVHPPSSHIRIGPPNKKKMKIDETTSAEELSKLILSLWRSDGFLLCLVTANWPTNKAADAARHILKTRVERSSPNVAEYLLNQVYDYKGMRATLKTHLILIGTTFSLAAYQSLTFDGSHILSELDNFTSLHVACSERDEDMVRRLVEPEDVRALCLKRDTKAGVIPLHIAALVDDWTIFVKLMMITSLSAGTMAADTCRIKCTLKGRTAAHYAVLAGKKNGNEDCRVLQWLLQHECVPFDEADADGKTVLELAVEHDQTRAARLICEAMNAKLRLESGDRSECNEQEDNISWHDSDSGNGDASDHDILTLSED